MLTRVDVDEEIKKTNNLIASLEDKIYLLYTIEVLEQAETVSITQQLEAIREYLR